MATSTGHSWLANFALAVSSVTMWPAVMERRFRGQGLDPGYVTTWPRLRGTTFYNRSNAEDRIIEVDEETKDVSGILEAPSAMTASVPPVPIPSLVVGAADTSVCGPGSSYCSSAEVFADREREKYVGGLTVVIVPDSGHVLNLERSRMIGWTAALTFLK
ncbi:hypothetical protein [Nocardia brasiliensis]|uniref:hypothetical protein n=1 Tax=Nocardia brasiliensis TaxID=37326 RepID=UPI003D938A9E